jgi:myo-inositol-1(or 4)-monophosphatase
MEKKDAGFVTKADLQSEEFLIGEIKKAYPQSDIVAEESGAHIHGNPSKWIIDPLDGTTNYGNRIPFFAISIALEEKGRLTHGAVYNPVTGELFYAVKGKGAWLNDEALHVGTRQDISRAVLSTGDTYYRGRRFDHVMKVLKKASHASRAVRMSGSVALSLAYTAAGKFDGFWLEDFNYWDVAAGILLVREAGGMVTDFEGTSLDVTAHSTIIAANRFLLPGMAELVSAPVRKGSPTAR